MFPCSTRDVLNAERKELTLKRVAEFRVVWHSLGRQLEGRSEAGSLSLLFAAMMISFVRGDETASSF